MADTVPPAAPFHIRAFEHKCVARARYPMHMSMTNLTSYQILTPAFASAWLLEFCWPATSANIE